ncbi:unnamed protein product [Polarella glacialis]|uniref:Uncharacterized protein n=1 Tax=Polarella glacialis TaxID=89957 RepID=A0A813F818_POLGL|nr:unnamed protein product [Polarella glacialis]
MEEVRGGSGQVSMDMSVFGVELPDGQAKQPGQSDCADEVFYEPDGCLDGQGEAASLPSNGHAPADEEKATDDPKADQNPDLAAVEGEVEVEVEGDYEEIEEAEMVEKDVSFGDDDQEYHDLDDKAALEVLLGEPGLAASLAAVCALGEPGPSRAELRGLRQLAEQSVIMGIDYKSLGLGWHHPHSRTAYREALHQSTTCRPSRLRAETSRKALVQLSRSLGGSSDSPGRRIITSFCDEISAAPEARASATLEGCLAALEAELLLPLRAFNEDRLAGTSMARTFNGDALPTGKIVAKVDELTARVLDGSFSAWRYSNPIGARQLEGLSAEQLELWKEPSRTEWEDGVVVHEDEPGELGFFWATKIGGPSHGFDLEGQCLLPLLCNARHKVVLVSDPSWPHHPAGRAHFRLLWTADKEQPRPVLWMEAVNVCFDADVNARPWLPAVLTHVARKAEAMGAILSVSPGLEEELRGVVRDPGGLRQARERLTLRPSNGVVEASDYLGDHDWLQETEETTQPISRTLYEPPSSKETEPAGPRDSEM